MNDTIAVSVSAEILVNVPEGEDAVYAEKVVADALSADERIFLAHASRSVLLLEQ